MNHEHSLHLDSIKKPTLGSVFLCDIKEIKLKDMLFFILNFLTFIYKLEIG